jgi:hypothetical protein
MMDWVGTSICVHIRDTRQAPDGPIRSANTTPASPGPSSVSFSSRSIPGQATMYRSHATAIHTATILPMELVVVAIRSLAHGDFTRLGRSCFLIALPQIICSRDGRKTSSAPIAAPIICDIRRSHTMARQPYFVGARLVFPIYPTRRPTCFNFGAASKSSITQLPWRQDMLYLLSHMLSNIRRCCKTLMVVRHATKRPANQSPEQPCQP